MSPGTKPGDYYVSIIDSASNAGHGRKSLALGPFRDDHAGALARVDEVRRYVVANFDRAPWWAYGTCRLDHDEANPAGKLNELLGMTA